MNALQSAMNFSYRNSACYDSTLQFPVDPLKTYEFNARLIIDAEFRSLLEIDTTKVLKEFGFQDVDFSKHTFVCPQLSEREMAELNAVALLVQKKGLLGNMALEQTVATDGYGMPAILGLLVWVAVAICLCLWVSIAGKGALSTGKQPPFYIDIPGSGVVPI